MDTEETTPQAENPSSEPADDGSIQRVDTPVDDARLLASNNLTEDLEKAHAQETDDTSSESRDDGLHPSADETQVVSTDQDQEAETTAVPAPTNDAQELPVRNESIGLRMLREPVPIAPDMRRMGFYYALSESKESVEKLITDTNAAQEKQADVLKEDFDREYERISASAEKIRTRLQEHEADFKTQRDDTGDLTARIAELQGKIDTLETEYADAFKALGYKQTNMVQTRIREVGRELDTLVATYHRVFDKKYGDSGSMKALMQKEGKELKRMRDKLKKQYKRLETSLRALYLLGLGDFSANFLVGVGSATALAGGWFFAAFTAGNELNSQNTLFFVLDGLFGLSFEFIQAFGSVLPATGAMLACYVGILLLVTVFIFLLELLLTRYSNDSPDHALTFAGQNDNASFRTRIAASTTFSYWLQVAPWLLVGGIMFILIAAGKGGDGVETLGMQLAGQAMGTLTTLACAGVFYVYIIKIIEPRLIKQQPANDAAASTGSPALPALPNEGITPTTPTENRLKKSLKYNIEILLVVGVFLSVIILLITGSGLLFTMPNNSLIALLAFLALTLISALSLGYGVRQSSLLATEKRLEMKIRALTRLITILASEKPEELWKYESQQFNRGYLNVQESLFDLMQARNLQVGGQDAPKPAGTTNKFLVTIQSVMVKAGKLLRSTHTSEVEQPRPNVSSYEGHFFPGARNHLSNLEDRLRALVRERNYNQQELEKVRAGKSSGLLPLTDKMKRLDHQLYVHNKQLRKLQLEYSGLKLQLDQEILESAFLIRDGYTLGSWMLKSGAYTPALLKTTKTSG